MRDPACVFCKILDGQIPATKVFQDDACMAFLDIGPVADGHLLLVSADHVESIGELSPQQASAMLRNLPALVRAVRAATLCQGVNVLQNNGRIAHQVVPHVHFHVIPRKAGDEFHFNWPAGAYGPSRAEELAKAIRDEM